MAAAAARQSRRLAMSPAQITAKTRQIPTAEYGRTVAQSAPAAPAKATGSAPRRRIATTVAHMKAVAKNSDAGLLV